ncbi:MAG: hypothetical protein WCL51_16440 [Bacteroidota bacterium]
MELLLNDIFELEDRNEFEKVYTSYQNIYNKTNLNYDIWKHFYFFLWSCIEEASNEFQEKINLRKELEDKFNDGKQHFSNLADFNFIAGYTITIFPYEYGDYEDLGDEGVVMLLKATMIEPKNLIYKMVYLGGTLSDDKNIYDKAVINAAPLVLKEFSGKGFLNRYFKEVLYRI